MDTAVQTAGERTRSRWAIRGVVAVLLFSLGAAAAYGWVLAHWIDTVLLDTDTFVSAIAPLVEDDEVRDAASEAISAKILDALDVRELAVAIPLGVATDVVEELAVRFDDLVRATVTGAVATDTFAQLWTSEMRRWHIGLVGAVRADGGELISEEAVLRVTLGPYIDLLIEQIEPPLLRLLMVNLVPDTVRQMRVVVFGTDLLADRLELLRSAHSSRAWLPWLAITALLAGALAAGRVDRSLVGAGALLAIGGFVGWGMTQAERVRVQTLVETELGATTESASTFAVTLFGPLETWIGYLALAGVGIAVAGVIVGRFGAGRAR